MADTAYIIPMGIEGPNPSFGEGTLGMQVSWVIVDDADNIVEGPADGIMANFNPGDSWSVILANLTTVFQSNIGDPDLTVTVVTAS